MASRSYVPRHAVVPDPSAPGGRRAVTILAASVGVAAATTALANPAEAKDGHRSVWDRVATCESGQRWHVDTGNGYYGGLQFSASTWRAYHGSKYAGHADNATRMEQIQVARRVLKSQGRDAWPVCGPRAGLTKGSGDATAASLPSDANGSPQGSSTNHTNGEHTNGKHTNGAHKVGARKHHAGTRHHHKSRTNHAGSYVVRSGDTLTSIARAEHVHGGWHALYRANRARLSNPNVLHVGAHLILP